jgi:hypothetical protein
MTVIRRDGLNWVAPKDGFAHAAPRSGGHRTLCDRTATPDRYAWPIREFCATCLRLEKELVAVHRREARIARAS